MKNLNYRKRISLGKHVKANISKSGISLSTKVGPISLNSKKGITSIKTPIKGLTYRPSKKKR